ncbi:MAG: alpha/beta hydrolase, partial [Comamonadaceae bacterium]
MASNLRAQRAPPVQTLPPPLSGETFAFDSAGARVAGYVAGNGPPMLLVHSVNAAASAAEVRPLFEHYAATHTVFAIDLPGFGLSDRTPRHYVPRLMTDAVLDALAAVEAKVGAQPVHVLGLSLACEFVVRAALEAPQRVRSLALVSPTGLASGPARRGRTGHHLGMPWLLRGLRAIGSGRPVYRGLTRPGVIRYFLRRTWGSPRIDEALWRYDVLTARAPGAEHAPLHFVSGYLFSADIEDLYDRLTVPVWMCHGIRGDFTNYRKAERFVARPNWRIAVFPAGALPQFEVLPAMTQA